LTNYALPEELIVARKELDGQLYWQSGMLVRGRELLLEAQYMEQALRYTEPTWYPRPIAEVLARMDGDKSPNSGNA
jgi:hypothetical protein